MKNNFKLVMTGLFLCALLFASCSNMLENIDENSDRSGGKISLSVGLAGLEDSAVTSTANADGRTVMPIKDANSGTETLEEITLYYRGSGDEVFNKLASWDSVTVMQKTSYSETITAGTYDFKLTAVNYGATMEQTLSSKTVSDGSTTSLAFTNLAASSDSKKTGGIYVYASYRIYQNSNQVAKGMEKFANYTSKTEGAFYTVKLDDGILLGSAKDADNITKGKEGETFEWDAISTSTYKNNCVAAGNHILTYTFTAPDGEIFVYPVAIQVKTGYLSKATIYPLDSLVSAEVDTSSSVKVTYNANTGSDSATASQTFYTGSLITDAEALGFSASDTSKRFKYWTTEPNGNGTKYYSGKSAALSADTTLYAQWGTFYKVTYAINLDDETDYYDLTYTQQFESGSTLVSDKTAFATFAAATKNYDNYTFCGWDTSSDGSGTRYAENTNPSITEDTVLYAQWCGAKSTVPAYSGWYTVKNAAQWNALMGSPFANKTSGTISVNAVVINGLTSTTVSSPALSLTSGKTFDGKLAINGKITGMSGVLFDTISSEATINTNDKSTYVPFTTTLTGPLCNTNNGSVYGVTVSGCTMTGYSAIAKTNSGTINTCSAKYCTFNNGSYGCTASICGQNTGTVTGCSVTSCTVNGSGTYTGGLVAYNEGTVTHSQSVTASVKGSSNDSTYTGGLVGYNSSSGTILGSGKVDISALTGSDEENSYYGYVIGYNENNSKDSVSTDITTTTQETLLSTGTIEVDSLKRYEITLSRTSLISATFTDTDANAAALYGYISSVATTNKKDITSYYIYTDKVSSTSYNGKVYLKKGTYYVYLTEEYLGKNAGCSAVVTQD